MLNVKNINETGQVFIWHNDNRVIFHLHIGVTHKERSYRLYFADMMLQQQQ